MATTKTYTEVFRFDFDAWQIHRRNESIKTTDDYHDDHNGIVASLFAEDDEPTQDWSAEITELEPSHTALRVGDAVYCEGYGSDVVILRLS